jgi:hypothetical protein
MGEGFVKLYASILDSSVWSYDKDTRIVWITLLAMADAGGIVHAAIPGIAHRANISIEATEKAMKIFQEPDPYSRSENFDGRRVGKDGRDWIILNFDEHRKRQQEEDEKERKRRWWRENRSKAALEKKKNEKLDVASETSEPLAKTSSSEADTDTEADKEEKSKPKKKVPTYPPDFETFWQSYPNKVGKGEAVKAWQSARKSGLLPPADKLIEILGEQISSREHNASVGVFVPPWPNPSTWLNQRRWEDEVKQASGPSPLPAKPKTQYEKNMEIIKRKLKQAEQQPLKVNGTSEVIR